GKGSGKEGPKNRKGKTGRSTRCVFSWTGLLRLSRRSFSFSFVRIFLLQKNDLIFRRTLETHLFGDLIHALRGLKRRRFDQQRAIFFLQPIPLLLELSKFVSALEDLHARPDIAQA